MDAQQWDERYAGSALVWSGGPNAAVARELADLPPGAAVDLGCGEGRNALWLAERGWRVRAVDFSAVALAKGRTLAADRAVGDRVTWEQADATTWRGSELDLAVVAYLQLAAPQRRAAVRAAFGSLRPGGTFLLVAHDTTNLTDGTGGPQDPAVLMTAADVVADLAGLPAEVLSAERVARTVQPDPAHARPGAPGATAWDCLVRCVRT